MLSFVWKKIGDDYYIHAYKYTVHFWKNAQETDNSVTSGEENLGTGKWIFSFIYLFIYFYYFWLCWVFVSVRGLSLVAASGGLSSSRCAGLSLSQPLLLWSTRSRHAGSVIVAHGPSCSVACGIFPDQGSNPCPLHWQADSQPLRHQGSPYSLLFIGLFTHKSSSEKQEINYNGLNLVYLMQGEKVSMPKLKMGTSLVVQCLRLCSQCRGPRFNPWSGN